MEQLPGFVAYEEYRKVYHLNEFSYCLMQNSHVWFDKFSKIVCEFRLKKSKCDHLIFYRQSTADIILIIVYFDDIVITRNDMQEYHLSSHFCIPSLIPKTWKS